MTRTTDRYVHSAPRSNSEARAAIDAAYDALKAQPIPAPPKPKPWRTCGHNGCARVLFGDALFCSRGHGRTGVSDGR